MDNEHKKNSNYLDTEWTQMGPKVKYHLYSEHWKKFRSLTVSRKWGYGGLN